MTDAERITSTVDRVLETTRHRILTGEYQPGSRLRLNHLADESGVSLIPVREALRVLEAERLVRTVPNKGATVTDLSVEEINDIYAVRSHLEGEALALSKRLTKTEADALEAILVEMEAADAAGDTARTMQLHRQFHFGLYERTGSTWLLYLIDILWKHAERYQWLSLQHRRDLANEEHRAILFAMQRGAVREAAKAMRTHLDTTRELLENAYSQALQVAEA